MKKLLQALVLPALAGTALTAQAQNELSNFTATGRGGTANTFATDYQAIGINPANLGRRGGARVTLGLLEIGAGAGSQSLTKDQLKKVVFHPDDQLDDKAAITSAFAKENALTVNAAVTTVGLSIALPVGSVAFSNRHRVVGNADLNETAANILFYGNTATIYNDSRYQTNGAYDPAKGPMVSAALAGTRLQLQWTDEYNFAYGAQVISGEAFKLSVGAGYRYIRGIGMLDVRVDNGSVNAFSSLSPLFNVDYGAIASSPNFDYRSGSGLSPVGSGNGFDFGLAAQVGEGLRLGASLTDLGSMTWKGNVLTGKDQTLKKVASTGINTYNIFSEASQLFGSTSDPIFDYQPEKERKESLPAKLRAGVGYTVSEKLDVGLDFTAPLNEQAGNLTSSFIGAGLDFKPAPWVRLSTGATGGAGYGFSLPLGITLVAKSYEAGISTRDVIGLVADEHPYSSFALGFLRFKFGSTE